MVPLTSYYWWRADFTLEDCTMEDGAGGIDSDSTEKGKEYVPGMDTLSRAALSLKLDEDEASPDVLKFINDYGPPRHTTGFGNIRCSFNKGKYWKKGC